MIQSLTQSWQGLYYLGSALVNQLENPEIAPPLVGYPTAENPTAEANKVAETSAIYTPALPAQMESLGPPLEIEDKAVALASKIAPPVPIQPAALSSSQIAALIHFIQQRLIIKAEKIAEILTHLEAGREVLLFGPPGCGKTRLARLLCGQLCSSNPGFTPEEAATNYTLATATAEWTVYDTIGGIKPDVADAARSSGGLRYRYEPGVVARAALNCEASLKQTGRPHYLLLDEFNRANQERAFGELFTILEYRDRPLLPAEVWGRSYSLFLPPAFRLVGTMNADDRNSLFETGFALRRRFALVEISVPAPELEQRFLPRSVQARLPQLKLLDGETFTDPQLSQALKTVIAFAAAVRPQPDEPANTGKLLGTALLIEVLVFCAVATRFYTNPQEALEDAIIANLLPQLERVPQAVTRAWQALETNPELNRLTRVQAALAKMRGNGFY